jgi:hypothetical protein
LKNSIRRITMVVMAAFAVMAMNAGTASAQYPPASLFGVTCTPANATAGSSVSCSVSGAQSGEVLAATATANTTFYSEDLNADADGNVAFAFQVPNDATGTVVVEVVGAESGSASDEVTLVAAGTDVPSDSDAAAGAGAAVTPGSGQLPFTGGEVTVLLAVAFGLLGAGLLFLRRREDAKVAA